MKDCIEVGDVVVESPVGAGRVTEISDAGFPRVNHVAVAWVRLVDGTTFDPHGIVGGSKAGRDAMP